MFTLAVKVEPISAGRKWGDWLVSGESSNGSSRLEPKRTGSQTFYRWVDGQGRTHVVASLDEVPLAERAGAASVSLNGEDAVGRYTAPVAPSSSPPWQPEWISFGVGFGLALVLALIFRCLPGSMRWVTRIALVLGAMALLMGVYLGLIRRTAGLKGDQVLTSPSALIQDARSAVEQMNGRQKQQDEELRQLQGEGAMPTHAGGFPSVVGRR
jgi:hypothetical protein